ncbi:MAG: 1-aminocyclopropane-1-carboxylate deaminase/D-cysteine desulfhydrase [Flavobacteriaceae bacterium]
MMNSPIQILKNPPGDYTIGVLREDRLDPLISGNKFRKLKYHLESYHFGDYRAIGTFGGAFSNHLLAVAAAGKKHQIPTLAWVRGEEWATKIAASETLKRCSDLGMTLHCIPRAQYAEWTAGNLPPQFSSGIYTIPEGGSNAIGVRGCMEILGEHTAAFDVVCVSVGTGATLAGIAKSVKPHQKAMGFLSLKHHQLAEQISEWSSAASFELCADYTFGGYGKIDQTLVSFMNEFYQKEEIPLDPIYTSKMLFGIFDLIQKKQWTWGSRILAIHTGGLQGLLGMHNRLLQKGQNGFTFMDTLAYY